MGFLFSGRLPDANQTTTSNETTSSVDTGSGADVEAGIPDHGRNGFAHGDGIGGYVDGGASRRDSIGGILIC